MIERDPSPREPVRRTGPVAGPIADADEARMLEHVMFVLELRHRLRPSLSRRR